MNLKDSLFYIAVITFLAIGVYAAYDFFIFDWRIDRSHKKIKESTQRNYRERTAAFDELFNYCKTLPSTRTIDFHEEGQYGFQIDSLPITKGQLDSLRLLVEKTNCEAISINEGPSINLRYDGNAFYEYIYLYLENTKNEDIPDWLNKLDSNVYIGHPPSLINPYGVIFDK